MHALHSLLLPYYHSLLLPYTLLSATIIAFLTATWIVCRMQKVSLFAFWWYERKAPSTKSNNIHFWSTHCFVLTPDLRPHYDTPCKLQKLDGLEQDGHPPQQHLYSLDKSHWPVSITTSHQCMFHIASICQTLVLLAVCLSYYGVSLPHLFETRWMFFAQPFVLLCACTCWQ